MWMRRVLRPVHLLLGTAVLALLVGTILVGCSRVPTGNESGSTITTVRLGYRPKALADVTPVILKEAGLAKPGVRVELVPVSSPPDAFQKFAANEVDAIAGIPLEPIFQQVVGGAPRRTFQAYYLQLDVSGEGWVGLVGNKKAGVSTLKDLAGKRVASLPTTQAQYLLRRILLAAGVPENGIHIVTYNPATPLLGLRSGEHAAIFGLEPALSLAVSEGHVILSKGPVSHFLYDKKPVPVSASLIAADFVKANPQAFSDFIEVVEEAAQIAKTEPDRVRAFLTKAEYGGLPPEVAERLFLPVMAKPEASLRSVAEKFVDDLVKDGQLREKVDLSALFPPTS